MPESLLKTLFWHRARKGKEIPERQRERFGIPSHKRNQGYWIWIHGASVGELASVRGLINLLLQHDPNIHILITSGTVASSTFIEPLLSERCIHQFIPYDLKNPVQGFLNYWRPDLALWIESEFWPALLCAMKERNMPVYLLNGRMSYKSFRAWKKDIPGIKDLLEVFHTIFAQSKAHEARFKALGAARINVLGNMKLVNAPLPVDTHIQNRFQKALGKRPWFMAASTHPQEEESVLDAYDILRREHPDLLLVLAPRHPDRCASLEEMMTKRDLKFCKESACPTEPFSGHIYMIDRIGVLGSFFALQPLVFLGGSLVSIGGHNFIEPIELGALPILGPYMHKQEELLEPFEGKDVLISVNNSLELAHSVGYFLRYPHEQTQKLELAKAILKDHQHLLQHLMSAIFKAPNDARQSA